MSVSSDVVEEEPGILCSYLFVIGVMDRDSGSECEEDIMTSELKFFTAVVRRRQ